MSKGIRGSLLFVDDDPQSLILYKRKFEETFRVYTAANGHDALEIMQDEEVDVIISDLRMPEMDGIELLSRIQDDYPQTLRVIITAFDDYERIVDSLNSGGINHSFKKPVNFKYLNLVLVDYLEKEKMKIHNREFMDSFKEYSKELSDKLKARTEELREAYRLLDESDRRYKYAVKAAKQGIIDWGISDDALVLNDVFFENLGYDRYNMNIRNLEDLKYYIHPEHRAAFFNKLKKYMKSGGTMEMRLQLLSKSGVYVWHNFVGLVVEWDSKNRPVRFIGACIDISRQLTLEEKLREANEELRIINEVKHNFIANVSHELRTPMNSILGFASLYDGAAEEGQKTRYVQQIKSSAHALNQVIDNMIAFAAVKQEEALEKASNFKLDKLLQDVGSRVSEMLSGKNVEYTVEIGENIPIFLMGNEVRLKKTLLAVLDNATKFTKSGRIDLRVSAVGQENGMINLEFGIKDTGIGMETSQLENIHIAFKQADDSSSRSYDGLGLGINLAVENVRKMNGQFRIESQKDMGTRVTIRIPFRMAYEVRRIRTNLIDVGKFNVLLYKESGAQREELVRMLKGFGFAIREAADIDAFRDMIQKGTGVQFILGCAKELDDIRQMVSLNQHIVIAIEDYSNDFIQGWINASIKKPIISSELYNAFIESLVKFHPKLAKQEIELDVPGKTIERIEEMRVLVVEDSLTNRHIMKNILDAIKVQADFAEDGERVLEMDALEAYDLIFMDINLPGMNGDEVCEALRQRPELENLAILGLTANMDAASLNKYRQAGMNDILHKPYNVDQIFSAIEDYAGVLESERHGHTSLTAADAEDEHGADEKDIFANLYAYGVDVAGAMKRLGGNEQAYIELLSDFERAYSNLECAKFTKDGDLHASCHAIRGIASNLGAVKLGEAAGNLEKLGDHVSEDEMAHYADVFENNLSGFIEGIKAVLSQRDSDTAAKAGDKFTWEETERFLTDAASELQSFDTSVIDRFRETDLDRFESEISEALKKAYASIQGFDFESALLIIEKIESEYGGKGRE